MRIELLFYNETNEDVEVYEAVIKEVITEAVKYEQLTEQCCCNYIFVNNDKIQEMNRQFREKDYATDVLTFPAIEEPFFHGPKHLGDVFISIDKMIEQAYAYGHGEVREMSFLAVHGFLHLLGYDHLDEEEEKVMFAKQEAILNAKNIRR